MAATGTEKREIAQAFFDRHLLNMDRPVYSMGSRMELRRG